MSAVSRSADSHRGSSFLGLPSSALGRIAAVLFLVVVVSIVLMATVVEPSGASWRGVFAIFIVVCVALTAVSCFVAVAVQRERSWAVVIPALLCGALLVNEVLQRL